MDSFTDKQESKSQPPLQKEDKTIPEVEEEENDDNEMEENESEEEEDEQDIYSNKDGIKQPNKSALLFASKAARKIKKAKKVKSLQTSLNEDDTKAMITKTEQMIKKITPNAPKIYENYETKYLKKSMNEIMRSIDMESLIPFVQNDVVQNNSKLPETVKSLDYYCQRFGLLPMGTISKSPGVNYIGRTMVHGKDNKIHHGTIDFGEKWFVETPDIGRNICFFANKAVEKWNEYAKSESDLLVFLNKIGDKEKQKKFMLQAAKECSVGTSMYKILATLYYFYVEQDKNILGLDPHDAKMVRSYLKTTDTIEKVYSFVIAHLTRSMNDKVNFVLNYIETKSKFLRAFVDESIYRQIEQYINDPIAYLSNEMIQFPKRALPQWVNPMVGKPEGEAVFATLKWEPDEEYFFADNYLKF